MREGWGMTFDGNYLVADDSTNKLFKIDPKDFTIKQKINVTKTYPNGL